MYRTTRHIRTLPRTLAILIAFMLALGTVALPATAQDGTPASDSPFFNQEDFERQLAQRDIAPEGPEDQPWIQAIEPEYADTSEYATPSP